MLIFKEICLAAAIILATISCNPRRPVPQSLAGVKKVVASLDSTVTAMYGWEPRDSTYNPSVDTLVADIMDELGRETYSSPAVKQEAYDKARAYWAKFKRLCDADRYRKALDFYLGDTKSKGKNAGDFLLYLKHSSQRFVFFSEVLMPMMVEYKGEEFATEEYISLLQLEKAMEDATIEMSRETNGYVPEVYPQVIEELGLALASTGKMNEAQELVNDYVRSIYDLTGNALEAYLRSTYYLSKLYLQDDDPQMALATWQNLKDFIESNKPDFDFKSEYYDQYLEIIDTAIGILAKMI